MKILRTKRVRLKILKTKISGFWQEYKKSKVGILGLLMVASFVFIAIFGPWLAPYNPNAEMLSTPISLPEIITILPEYSDWPRSFKLDVKWNINLCNNFNFQFKEELELANMLKREKIYVWSVRYSGEFPEETECILVFNFTYAYKSPAAFKCSFRWRILNLSEAGYNLELTLMRYGEDGIKEYSLWDSNFKTTSPRRSTKYLYTFDVPDLPTGFPKYVEIGSGRESLYKGRLNFTGQTEFLDEVFSNKGEYALAFYVRVKPKTSASTIEVQIFDFEFSTLGKVHGLLGTDDRGRDIFSRILYGARVSLMVGLLVALISTSIGALIGTISGYLGGWVDEMSMRFVDLLLCIPLLPLLLAAAEMFQRNLYIVMFIIVIFSWMPLARMIRSQVLSLREMTFIEAAKASGATKFKILTKHILPNVLPLAFSYMILSIPAAILIEASLSFLGLGDPSLVTWGRIINEAMVGGALAKDAWWWLFSPGIAIVLVCLSFVFVAHAFDAIVNPRLRIRK